MAATIRCTSSRKSKNLRQITPPFFFVKHPKTKKDETTVARTKRANGTADHEGFVSTLWGDRCPLRADPRAVSPACLHQRQG